MPTPSDFAKRMLLLWDGRNSLLFWYPRVKDIVPTPKSVWLGVEHFEAMRWLDTGIPKGVIDRLLKLAEEVGGFPLFMKTDVFSDKWDYERSCYVGSPEKLAPNLLNILDTAGMHDLLIRAIVLREYVELDWRFKAFAGRMPVAPEVRVMLKDGKVEDWFFYWPEGAIWGADRGDWRDLLAEMREIAESEKGRFLRHAKKIAEAFGGYWSADFARTRKGEWILIDMALGEVSWKPVTE